MLHVLYSIHAEKGNEILMIEDSGFNGFKGFKRFKGFKGFRWRLRRILDDGILVSSAFPKGEGAPKGRIGHWRYEREWEGASPVTIS